VFTTAEDSQSFWDITKPVNDTNAGIPGAPGGAGFDSQWGYPFYYSFQPQLTLADNDDVNMNEIANLISNFNGDGGDNNRVLFTENHDMASNQNKGRIPAQVNPGGSPYTPNYWAQKKSMLGIGVLLTTSLYPMLFYGQEMLTYATFDFPVPPAIDWGVVNANSGLVQEVTDLISLRINKNGNTFGLTGFSTSILQVLNSNSDKVCVYLRSSNSSKFSNKRDQHQSGDVVVVLNMHETQYNNFKIVNIPYDGVWNVRFNGDNQEYSSLYGDFGVSQSSITVSNGIGVLKLPKYSILILSQ